jgi:hypothetical protein
MVVCSHSVGISQRSAQFTLDGHEAIQKHGFLIVAMGPEHCCRSALNKITRKSDRPCELTPHVLPHTWNERLTEFMDNGAHRKKPNRKCDRVSWFRQKREAAAF